MDFRVRAIENDTEEDRMLNELFVSPLRDKYVEVGEEKFVFPTHFCTHWEEINKFEVRDDDVFITGHMKNGTTWVHEITDLIVNGVNTKDTNKVRLERFHFLDTPIFYNTEILGLHFPRVAGVISHLNALEEGPRCIRSHLPWFLLPEQIRNGTKSPKIIHVRRNPKDTCISFYHHNRSMDGYRGSFEEFCRLFLAGRLIYGPFFSNIKTYWEQRNRPNVLLVKYSDLKKDLPGMIKKMAAFLEKSLTEKEVQDLVEYVSSDSMKKHVGREMNELKQKMNAMYNFCVEHTDFVRECKEDGYKTEMSQELIQIFDKVEKEVLSGTDLSF